MLKQDKRDLLIGIVLILAGILGLIWINGERVRYITAKEHYKVEAKLVSSEEITYFEDDSNAKPEKRSYYLAEWEYYAGGEIYTISSREDTRPFSTKNLYVYKAEDGEFVVSSAGTIWEVWKWNFMGALSIVGGVVYILQSVKRIRLRNARRRRN